MFLPAIVLAASTQALPPARWFVLLVRDVGPRPTAAAELEAMQKAHIGNIVARYNERRFLAAGPLNDPTNHRRGIVVLNVETRADVEACFTEDPYVRAHIMRIDAHKWAEPVRGFAVAKEVDKIVPQRMIRLTSPTMTKPPLPKVPGGVGGWFAGERMGTILTATTDDAALRSALGASPAVRAGTAYEIVELYMAPGVLAP